MAEVCVNIPDELKEQAEESNLDLSILITELIRREVLKRQLLKKLNSKDEQELTKWSVELGRKTKKGRFKKLLEELSSKL